MTGYVPEPPALLEALDAAGGIVVADDYAAIGRRVIRARTAPGGDPFARLAERYLAAPPCPTRSADEGARVAHLVARAEATGARGVVAHVVRSCEPELFDLPALRAAFAARGLPLLVLETELERTLSAQAVTRVEAFVEMLAGGRAA